MKLVPIPLALFCLALLISPSAHAQNSIDSTITADTKFELVNDTLTSSSGLKIYPGQKFRLGNGAGPDGRYRSIVSKYAALVPNIWGRNNGYEYLIENYVDNKKGKKQIAALAPGQAFTLGKIAKAGKNQFMFYFTSLSSEANDYRCDILLALKLKELLFQ
jgi:hypothetical protein